VVGALLLASVLGASCRQGPALPASALHDLASLDQFRVAFNAEASRPRLIVVLAPT
jgi:hypothetical protein